jgi:RNAse (barnase) inhibitor barstar
MNSRKTQASPTPAGYGGVPPQSVMPLRDATSESIAAVATQERNTFVHVALGACTDKAAVMAALAAAFHFSPTFGGNLDALYDALTDLVGTRGYAIVLEGLPVAGDFDADVREALLDVFRDAAEFHAGAAHPFRVFYSLLC